MKIVIVGGVAAGTKTAAKLKRENRAADVVILTKDRDISYAGCALPYYVGGEVEEKEQLIVNTPAKLEALTEVRVLTGREVYQLCAEEKRIQVRNLETGAEETYVYDALVIASGASPVMPNIKGAACKGVFKLRVPQDAIDMREYLEEETPRKAVVVGGGFIGLETAENLKSQGLSSNP